jgi:hypothetical protein
LKKSFNLFVARASEWLAAAAAPPKYGSIFTRFPCQGKFFLQGRATPQYNIVEQVRSSMLNYTYFQSFSFIHSQTNYWFTFYL